MFQSAASCVSVSNISTNRLPQNSCQRKIVLKKNVFFCGGEEQRKKRVKGAFHKQAIRFVARLTGERSREWGRWKRSIAGEKTKLVGRPLVRWFQCRSVLLRPKGYRTAALTHFLNENSPLGTDAGSQKKKLTGDKQVDQYINRFFW